jgi:hypothetical protein
MNSKVLIFVVIATVAVVVMVKANRTPAHGIGGADLSAYSCMQSCGELPEGEEACLKSCCAKYDCMTS